jgi:ankyrin repeat protein
MANTLWEAVRRGEADELRRMLQRDWLEQNGVDPKKDKEQAGQTPLMLAAALAWAEGVEILLPASDPLQTDDQGRTALMRAVCLSNYPENRFRAVKALLPVSDAGTVSLDGSTAGQLAIANSLGVCAQALIDQTPMNQQTGNGMTPLMWAAGAGGRKMLRLVFERLGDNIEAAARTTAKNGHSALMIAAEGDNEEALRALLPLSDPKLKGADGKSALAIALERGSLECVQALLPAWSAEELVDESQGPSVVQIAAWRGPGRLLEQIALACSPQTQREIWTAHGNSQAMPRLWALQESQMLSEAADCASAAAKAAQKRGAPRI